jgi:hypothetical protein
MCRQTFLKEYAKKNSQQLAYSVALESDDLRLKYQSWWMVEVKL